MMQSMEDLQHRIHEGKSEEGSVMGVEVARSGAPDLPNLMPWASGTGPLQLGDWMLLLNPIISDLSTTSQDWRTLMTQEAETWYQRHVAFSPLDRTSSSCISSTTSMATFGKASVNEGHESFTGVLP